MLYVLDEPTIGLHPRDNHRLLHALHKLRDLGNTLLVVEHDREVIAGSDQLLDFGPAAGKRGGQIVAQGTPASSGPPPGVGHRPLPVRQEGDSRAHEPPDARSRKPDRLQPGIVRRRNMRRLAANCWRSSAPGTTTCKNIDVRIPLGTLTAVTGASGSGKSSLIEDVLYTALARTLHRASLVPGAHERIAASSRSTR